MLSKYSQIVADLRNKYLLNEKVMFLCVLNFISNFVKKSENKYSTKKDALLYGQLYQWLLSYCAKHLAH